MKRMDSRIIQDASSTCPSDADVSYLQAEMARLDVLLQRQVRRWQLANQDPADSFRGLCVSDHEAEALLARPLAANWGQLADMPLAEEQAFSAAERQATLQARALAESARCQGRSLRFVQLAITFNLDRFDLDTLLICLAPALDLRYERLYGYLQDDVTKKRPCVNLVLDLLCETGATHLSMLDRFADDAPLFRHHLLERIIEPGAVKPPLLAQALVPDEAVAAWFLGHFQPHVDLRPHATLLAGLPTHETVPLDTCRCQALADMANRSPEAPLIIFHGPDTLAQEAAARRLAAMLGRPLLAVDLAAIIEAGIGPQRAVTLALRDARLNGALPYLAGWDACLAEGAVPPDIQDLVCRAGLVITAGQVRWQCQGIERARRIVDLEFPVPDYAQRCALWHHFLALDAPTDATAVAGQFALTAGQIRDAFASARDLAAQHGETLQSGHLLAAARACSNPRLSSLARKITPRYGWQDIVLPADQIALLREIVATVRGRPIVLDEWGLGRKLVASQGITLLFAGPPGTGKTMAAEIVAGELGLDLYQIDLSTVVSKYIGETEKNLERIFVEAERSNAILFFDEADALFGKRSEVRDAHDRYANIEISYLLQRMEAYDGVTILATNLHASLDEAFIRRLQFAVNFPFPEEQDRLRIWQTLFPPGVPRAADLDFGLLAGRFKLAGGNIRNIIVGAAYLASNDGRCVTMDMLLHSTRRELQKMGRLVNEAELVSCAHIP